MREVLEVIAIVLLFASFAVLHSVLAAIKVKRIVKEKFPKLLPYYRLIYNLVALFCFYIIYEIAPHPDRVLYDLLFPYDIMIFVLQIFSLLGIIWSVSVIDGYEFLGWSQIKRLLNNNYDEQDLDEKSTLYIKGPFRIVRHPIYFFFILFLGLRPTMDLYYIAFYVCIVVYFYLGTFYEEKRLIGAFGNKYERYQKLVPRLIPRSFVASNDLKELIEEN